MTAPAPPAPAVGFELLGLRSYSRVATTFSTASLASAASEVGTVDLAPGYRLLKVQANRPARLRLYGTTGQRSLDVGRPEGTDPDTDTDHGLFLEFIFGASLLSAVLSPEVDAHVPSGVAVPWAVTNKDASTGVVTITLTWVRTE